MFEATHPFAFFDYFRVPYDVVPADADREIGTLTAQNSGRKLFWYRGKNTRTGRFRIGAVNVAGRIHTGPVPVAGTSWRRTEEVLGADGRPVAAVQEDADGNVFLPFDPGQVMGFLWSESYTTMGSARVTRKLRKAMVKTYYAVRPLLPRPLQLRMRRTFAKHQAPPEFPAWPVEHGLQDLYDWLLELAGTVAGEPVPWIDLWPEGKTWTMVLTHDVEQAGGRDDIELLRGPERERGYRSSWNFVPERYVTSDDLVAELKADGCEVGVHGLRHDGRDIASRRLLEQRLPAMRSSADRWGAAGFRSPATQRRWDLMPTMGFDYDSSYTDSDPYEPQPGGCCTYLPFFNEELVELPITLPQDHTVFEILQHDGSVWVSKAHAIRERRGMVLVLVHPDYARDERLLTAWSKLLDEFAHDETVWQALPREVATWWRDRAGSRLVHTADGWVLDGPVAGRGRVRHGLLVRA
ncbi:hypothetical protein ACFV9C_28755 [Kribbella sp. NPDC059898]|uniref:hypothetical protein n=1 Tax=Kribbella sp. NPDC059898 TaxID=3346995 RepID=UPI003666E5F9